MFIQLIIGLVLLLENESEGITGLVVQRQENERDVSLEAATVTTVEHPMSSLSPLSPFASALPWIIP